MDNGEEYGDVFAIPDLWGQSQLTQDFESSSSFLFSQLRLEDINTVPPFSDQSIEHTKPVDGFFAIPDLLFEPQDEVIPPIEPTNAATGDINIERETEEFEQDSEDNNELWVLDHEPIKKPQYLSWDVFEDQKFEEPCTSYITEAGPRVFDAALASDADLFHIGVQTHLVIETPIYASCLLALGLGRSSLLFSWAEEKDTFVPMVDALRLSGCTGQTVQEHASLFMRCGNLTRRLQSFVDDTYAKNTTPGRIALADAVSTILSALQAHLSIPSSSIQSIIELQALFKPAETLLQGFHHMVQSVALAKSDEVMLSELFQEIQRLEHASDSLKEVLLEVLARISRPFLDFAGEWIGTEKESNLPVEKTGAGKSFVKTENRFWIDEQGAEMQEPDFVLESSLIPGFISEEDAQIMFETGRSLRFLRTHHSNHPLARPDVIASAHPPKLDWNFSWQSIEQVEAKALQYEKDLTAAIKQYSNTSTADNGAYAEVPTFESNAYEFDFFGQSEKQVEAKLLASMDNLSLSAWIAPTADRLTTLLATELTQAGGQKSFDDTTFAPPISLTPLLSFSPLIAAQARMINNTSMRLFFKEHNLREHLSIQRQFQLLGNGVFSSRLSHALFDPELDTAERKAGVARTGGIVGLRLEARDTWPPASSELRLALMGLLTESYVFTKGSSGGKGQTASYLDRKSELPGDLSFAVRDMSDEEIEKCMDPNSLEALDFLRLSYKPPPPLEAVITPMSMYKYDQLFKLLLRVVRMMFVVSQLFRDATDRSSYWQGIDPIAQRFRIETHHFVSCVSSYFFDVGIDATWHVFERKLDKIEARINCDDEFVVLGPHEGLDKLREYHERVLDRIMFALLLRKRQQPVMKLLEEIFALILKFAKYSRRRALGEVRKVGMDEEVKEMYVRFRKKVEVFITVCRGLSEKKGYGEKRTESITLSAAGGLFDSEELAEENTIVQLLSRLEMSGYYSNRKPL